MNNSHNFRVGFQPFANRCPTGTKPGKDAFLWYIEESKRLGTHALSLRCVEKLPEGDTLGSCCIEYADWGYVREMAAIAKEADIDFVTGGPHLSLAGLPHPATGEVLVTPDEAKRQYENILKVCEIFNCKTVSGGYGRLNYNTSRYCKDHPFSEVRKFIIANLKELGKILEGTDVLMGYENHCDFSGKEVAGILEEVDHPNIGCQYDTGNAASVVIDPNDDIDYLAPWTVSMHVKDMKVIDNPVHEHIWQDMPLIFKGTYLGEGIVDWDRLMTAVCEKGKRKEGIIMLSEPAFILPINRYNNIEEMYQFDRECTYQFVDFMKKLVEKY